MSNSFGSSLWMLPYSKYCRADTVYSRHFSSRSRKGHHVFHCDEHEFQANYSGWPTNIVNIEIPSNKGINFYSTCRMCFWCSTLLIGFKVFLVLTGDEAYPSFAEIAHTNLSGRECVLPTLLSFSAREVADGTVFQAITNYDPDSYRLLHMLNKWVSSDFYCSILLISYYVLKRTLFFLSNLTWFTFQNRES